MSDQPEWPADRPERRALSSLRPFARNARTHSPEQIDQVVASIKRWGWTMPVLIDDDGEIIAGHARVLAAQKLELVEVPVLVARGWSEAQKRAYVIADNKLALNSGWDENLLRLEMGDLRELGSDLSELGFQPMEIDQLFAPDNDLSREWQGMPEFQQGDEKPYRTIAIHFANAEDVARFAQLVQRDIHPKTKWLWYPQQVIESRAGVRYLHQQEPAA